MNTDVRRAIFMILMSSEDYLDAYAKIMKLGLKHKQVRPPLPVRQWPTFRPARFAGRLESPLSAALCSLGHKCENKTTFVVAGRWAHGCWRHAPQGQGP
jgi:hypothetical protein